MFKLKETYWFASGILFILGLFSVLNGLFHYFWYDSGAGSVAGFDLSGPAGSTLVFMLAVVGQIQVIKGLVYLYVALKENRISWSFSGSSVSAMLHPYGSITARSTRNPWLLIDI
jgi:hypothetical protein